MYLFVTLGPPCIFPGFNVLLSLIHFYLSLLLQSPHLISLLSWRYLPHCSSFFVICFFCYSPSFCSSVYWCAIAFFSSVPVPSIFFHISLFILFVRFLLFNLSQIILWLFCIHFQFPISYVIILRFKICVCVFNLRYPSQQMRFSCLIGIFFPSPLLLHLLLFF